MAAYRISLTTERKRHGGTTAPVWVQLFDDGGRQRHSTGRVLLIFDEENDHFDEGCIKHFAFEAPALQRIAGIEVIVSFEPLFHIVKHLQIGMESDNAKDRWALQSVEVMHFLFKGESFIITQLHVPHAKWSASINNDEGDVGGDEAHESIQLLVDEDNRDVKPKEGKEQHKLSAGARAMSRDGRGEGCRAVGA